MLGIGYTQWRLSTTEERDDAVAAVDEAVVDRRPPDRAPEPVDRPAAVEVPGSRSPERGTATGRGCRARRGLVLRRPDLPVHRPERRSGQETRRVRHGADPLRRDDPRLLRPEGAAAGHGPRRGL